LLRRFDKHIVEEFFNNRLSRGARGRIKVGSVPSEIIKTID